MRVLTRRWPLETLGANLYLLIGLVCLFALPSWLDLVVWIAVLVSVFALDVWLASRLDSTVFNCPECSFSMSVTGPPRSVEFLASIADGHMEGHHV